jgi:hypothetical protein
VARQRSPRQQPDTEKPRPGARVVSADGVAVGEVLGSRKDDQAERAVVVRVGLLFPVTAECPSDWIAWARDDELRLTRDAAEVLARLPVVTSGRRR